MPCYGPQFKAQIVKKLMPPYNQSVAQVSRDTGVSVPTLYAWKQLYRNQGYVVPSKSSRPDDWDAKAKLACIIETGATRVRQVLPTNGIQVTETQGISGDFGGSL